MVQFFDFLTSNKELAIHLNISSTYLSSVKNITPMKPSGGLLGVVVSLH